MELFILDDGKYIRLPFFWNNQVLGTRVRGYSGMRIGIEQFLGAKCSMMWFDSASNLVGEIQRSPLGWH